MKVRKHFRSNDIAEYWVVSARGDQMRAFTEDTLKSQLKWYDDNSIDYVVYKKYKVMRHGKA